MVADATALEIADAFSTILIAIDAALTPTLGRPAVILLFERSFLANARAYPWMASLGEGNRLRMDVAAVRMLLSRQPSPEAAAAGSAFLQTFYDLLVDLLGMSLSERLLRPVWANHVAS